MIKWHLWHTKNASLKGVFKTNPKVMEGGRGWGVRNKGKVTQENGIAYIYFYFFIKTIFFHL